MHWISEIKKDLRRMRAEIELAEDEDQGGDWLIRPKTIYIFSDHSSKYKKIKTNL